MSGGGQVIDSFRSQDQARRIVFVLPSLDGGGAERVSLLFLRGLVRHHSDVHLVLFRGGGAFANLVPTGVTVHELGIDRLRQALLKLVGTLRKLSPALVYSTHGYVNWPLLATRSLSGRQVRLLLREANTPSASLARQKYQPLFRAAYRMLYPSADALICQSTLMRTELRNDFGVPERRLHRIYNPVDLAAIRDGLAPERRSGNGPRFVAAGLFNYKKGFDRLLDWFALLGEEAHLTLLGEGPLEAELRDQAARLGVGDRITFAGFLPRPWAQFAGADAFLLPSRWEGMPNVALEALACGTPVIAMREAGGITDVAPLAREGAVSMAEDGAAFTAAMAAVKPSAVEALRPSLLPEPFHLAAAQDTFNRLVAQTLA